MSDSSVTPEILNTSDILETLETLLDKAPTPEVKVQLKTRILEFIAYFNRTIAKPFRWTYQGKALKQ